MGNLTRDPEVRFSQGGMAIGNLSVAVNERFKGADGEWQDRATYVEVSIFGKRAEAFAKFHKKGGACFLEGKLRLDQWEDKQTGQKRSKLFVVADSWEFVGGEKGGGKKSEDSEPRDYSKDDWNATTSAGATDDTPF